MCGKGPQHLVGHCLSDVLDEGGPSHDGVGVLVAWVTDGVVWVKVLLRLLTIVEVAVEDTAAASREVAGLINRAGGWMFLWLRRMAGGAGRVAWRRFLAARGILG